MRVSIFTLMLVVSIFIIAGQVQVTKIYSGRITKVLGPCAVEIQANGIFQTIRRAEIYYPLEFFR